LELLKDEFKNGRWKMPACRQGRVNGKCEKISKKYVRINCNGTRIILIVGIISENQFNLCHLCSINLKLIFNIGISA